MARHFHLLRIRQLVTCTFLGIGYVAILLLERLLKGVQAFWEETRTLAKDWLDLNQIDSHNDATMVIIIRTISIGLTIVAFVVSSYFVVWLTQLLVSIF